MLLYHIISVYISTRCWTAADHRVGSSCGHVALPLLSIYLPGHGCDGVQVDIYVKMEIAIKNPPVKFVNACAFY